uniref:Uncharacterized protein n=1 Tax=Rhizophora mucronata TaxID=61149 RepID=A0A2P2P5G4_RHIMU
MIFEYQSVLIFYGDLTICQSNGKNTQIFYFFYKMIIIIFENSVELDQIETKTLLTVVSLELSLGQEFQ